MRLSLRIAIALLAGMPMMVSAQTRPVGLTLDQYLVAGRSRLSARDADGDGRISASEFEAPRAGRRAGTASPAGTAPDGAAASPAEAGTAGRDGAADRMFARFDADHDGMLDKPEIDAMLTARFQRLDADHDGILTEEERRAGAARRGGAMKPDR